MKKIIGILAALMMCFTLNSCVTSAQAQIDDMYDDVDISVVVTYGTPYYDTEGLLLYFIYRDMYYYPYYHHNRYYLHRYSRPLPPPIIRERYKPVPMDAFKRHHKPNVRHDNRPPRPNRNIRPNNNHQPRPNVNRPNTPRPNNNGNVRPNTSQPRPNTNINRGGSRPNITPSRPTINNSRPSTPQRSSTRATTSGGGYFGGRR